MDCCTRLWDRYRSIHPEVRRYRINWIVIFCMNSLVGIAFFITLPSLHQFVTSSSHPEDPNVQPGLGLSETWYSWVVSMSSLGELIGAIVSSVLLRWFYTKHIILVNLCIIAVGGIIYGIGKFGWMLILGRLCVGLYQGGHMTMMRTYLGETSTTVIAMLPAEKQEKSKIKVTNFFITFTVSSTFIAIGPALPAVAAQIPHLDQFRWPGYYLTIHSCVVLVLVLFLFREKWTDLKRVTTNTGCQRKLPLPIYTIAYLVGAFFSVNWLYSVLDTLENPILGDNFGLTIEYTSYVFAAIVILIIASMIMNYILLRCGVDNRVIAIFCLILSILGALIAADWQSIMGDPCDQFSADNFVPFPDCSAALLYEQEPSGHYPIHVRPSGLAIYGTLNTSNSAPDVFMNSSLLEQFGSFELVSSCTDCTSTSFLESHSAAITEALQQEMYSLACQIDLSKKKLDCFWPEEAKCFSLALDYQQNSTENHTVDIDVRTQNSTWLLNVSEDNIQCLRSLCNDNTTRNTSSYCVDKSTDYRCLAVEHEADLSVCDGNTSASCVCEAFSGSPYHCFWNPNSRLTGEYCSRCEPLCRSQKHSIHFAQFVIGLSLVTYAFPMGRLSITLIASDALGIASQGMIMGLLVASGSAAKFTGPLWGNAAYLAAGRRTYLPMAVLAGLFAIMLVLFLLLYRTMKPKKLSSPSPASSTCDSEDEEELKEKAEDQQVLLKAMETIEDDPVTTVYLNHQSASDNVPLLEESTAV